MCCTTKHRERDNPLYLFDFLYVVNCKTLCCVLAVANCQLHDSCFVSFKQRASHVRHLFCSSLHIACLLNTQFQSLSHQSYAASQFANLRPQYLNMGKFVLDPTIRSQPDGQVPTLSISYTAPRILHSILRHGPGCDSRVPCSHKIPRFRFCSSQSN